MLEIKNLNVIFHEGTVNERVALKDFNLSVNRGDYICILGGNGAGKSTLFSVIIGSIIPKSGRVFLNGDDITFLPPHKRARTIGRLFQNPEMGSAPNMTIEENLSLSYGGSLKSPFALGVSKKNRKLFRSRLETFGLGLENRMTAKVKLLSGGERQALSLVMATIRPPKLLLLDEHTAALDPKTEERVMHETDRIIREHNLTTLMITHNIKEALSFGNKILMLKSGEIFKIWDKGEEVPDMNELREAYEN